MGLSIQANSPSVTAQVQDDPNSEMYNQVLAEITALMNAMTNLDGATNPSGMSNGDVNNFADQFTKLYAQLSGLLSQFNHDPDSMDPADRAWFEIPANRSAVQNMLNALNTPLDGQKGDPSLMSEITAYEDGSINISQLKSDISVANQPGNGEFATIYASYEYSLKDL